MVENATIDPAVCVRLLLFASYREIVGERSLEVEVPVGASADDLFRQVQGRHPALGPLRPSTTFAVNRSIVPGSQTLRDGDEVAFLQPVSGGTGD
ncbi:MAG: MoaD/ThiS family protein [Chloroflexota bacterium]